MWAKVLWMLSILIDLSSHLNGFMHIYTIFRVRYYKYCVFIFDCSDEKWWFFYWLIRTWCYSGKESYKAIYGKVQFQTSETFDCLFCKLFSCEYSTSTFFQLFSLILVNKLTSDHIKLLLLLFSNQRNIELIAAIALRIRKSDFLLTTIEYSSHQVQFNAIYFDDPATTTKSVQIVKKESVYQIKVHWIYRCNWIFAKKISSH